MVSAKKWLIGLSVMLMCGCLHGAASAQNVLANPGFESGALSPWFESRNFNGSEDWNVTTTSPHSGTFAATDVGNKELRQDFAGVAASSISEVSFWLSHPDAGVQAAAYDFFYTDGTDNEFLVDTNSTNYQFFDVTSQLDTTKVLDGFSVFGNTGGRTFLDDVVIAGPTASPTPEFGSVFSLGSLLAAGGAGLILKRRRQGIAKP